MHWRDDSAYRFAMLARTLVGMAPRDARLYAFVGGEVLRAAISSLGTETMGTHQADILQLIRDVLVQQIGEPSSAVHSVLASLPRTTPADLDRFRRQLLGLNSEKAQRDLTKRMLVGRRCCCCCCCCCCASGRVLCLWFVSLRGGRVGPTGDVLAAPSRAP
jgi:hypothetical protein